MDFLDLHLIRRDCFWYDYFFDLWSNYWHRQKLISNLIRLYRVHLLRFNIIICFASDQAMESDSALLGIGLVLFWDIFVVEVILLLLLNNLFQRRLLHRSWNLWGDFYDFLLGRRFDFGWGCLELFLMYYWLGNLFLNISQTIMLWEVFFFLRSLWGSRRLGFSCSFVCG